MPAKKGVKKFTSVKKRVKKGGEPPKTDEIEVDELPEAGGAVEEVEAEPRQLGRDELESLRRRLQEKFH